MTETAPQPDGWLRRLDPYRVVRLLLRRRVRLALAWLVALASTANMLHRAWTSAADPTRADGNSGHASIDFGVK